MGKHDYFPEIGQIRFEGRDTDNPLAYRYYDETRVVAGKSMREHFRFAVAFWHSLCGTGGDPFGRATRQLPWMQAADPMQQARDKMDAAFELITKLGLPYFCFHDYDLVEEADTLTQTEQRLHAIGAYAKEKMADSGVRVLWGTANLFSHPRYMNGAATNPDFDVVARAGAQVKMALDLTLALGGENYVFWGGREG
ncbi:MAG: xylose isomerase, partial [Saprospiraceae bacterium]